MDLKLDGLEFLHFCFELIKVSENYDVDGKVMVDIIMDTVDKNIDSLNGVEFLKFCFNLNKAAEEHDIDLEIMTTIMTEAAVNRERVLGMRVESKEETATYEPRQELYGPPPVKIMHEVSMEEPKQLLYGPPELEGESEVNEDYDEDYEKVSTSIHR